MLATPNLAIHLGCHRPAGLRQPVGALPPLPIPGFSAVSPTTSCLSFFRVVQLRTALVVTPNSAFKNFTEAFFPAPDGSFGQTYTDAGGAAVHYHGRIVGDIMDVDVDATNPPCEHHWHLKKE